jgi:peptidoglycan hydrolase-like protein with peptidoglycan-binding domain
MSDFSRKAVLGAAAVITTATTAFTAAGAAHAATTAQAAPVARATQAAPTVLAALERRAVVSWPLVVRGNRGERVVAVQYLLNQRGLRTGVDGIYGPQTTANVLNFQRRYAGIYHDGKVGAQTWPRLIVQVQYGSKGYGVSAIQHNLRFAYGYKIAVDGIFGPTTRSAVLSFQRRYGIGVDGIAGPITWSALVTHER